MDRQAGRRAQVSIGIHAHPKMPSLETDNYKFILIIPSRAAFLDTVQVQAIKTILENLKN